MIPVSAVGPSYAVSPLRRTHKPPKHRPYDEYRACLRLEFSFQCVYCLSTEMEVNPVEDFGGFEVEHFRPQGRWGFRRLERHYPNLLWACPMCNRAKGNTWPTPAEVRAGQRFVDPCADVMGDHLEIVGERVAPANGSHAGLYTIIEVNLNSGAHVKRRRERIELAKKAALVEVTCAAVKQTAIADAPTLVSKLDEVAARLKELLADVSSLRTPWDGPTDCACSKQVAPQPRRKTKRERMAQRAKERARRV